MSKAWMPLYIGDYLGDTTHLTQGQHGAYMLLLMHYWQRGSLPAELEQCFCIAHAMDEQSKSNVSAVLSEFFRLEGGRYRQQRMDAELDKAEKSYKRRAYAASKRWANAKHVQVADAMHEPKTEQSSSNPCDCDSYSDSAVDLNQDIESEIREIAGFHPKVKDPLHIPIDVANLIGEAIARHGRDLVWAGTKSFGEAVKRWPVSERQLAPSPHNFFRHSQYLTDPREWDRSTHGKFNDPTTRSERVGNNVLDGITKDARRADSPHGHEREKRASQRVGG